MSHEIPLFGQEKYYVSCMFIMLIKSIYNKKTKWLTSSSLSSTPESITEMSVVLNLDTPLAEYSIVGVSIITMYKQKNELIEIPEQTKIFHQTKYTTLQTSHQEKHDTK